MKERKIILKQIEAFEPKHIFECGQCFRWNVQPDGSYIGIVRNNVVTVKKVKDSVIFESMGEDSLEQLVYQYFDLTTDYTKIKETLSNVDEYVKTSIQYGEGIRILKQEVWETIISFMISANNNIPRIKGIIERISKQYGTPISWRGQTYYTFPTIEQLSKASVEELRDLGLGFRDKRVYQTTQLFKNKTITIQQLQEQPDTKLVKDMLMQLPGVGPKVADCILLFGLQKLEVFPIDVWVRRVMNDLYFKKEKEETLDKTEITKLATAKYANFAGLAQQYLFYWKRETA